MNLVELALQGVRGFAPQIRLRLEPGANIVRSTDGDLRSTVVDALYHCLYPDPGRTDATSALRADDAKESRIAVTFVGRDEKTYRILRDTDTGATRLFVFDPAGKKYQLLTAQSQEITQSLRVLQRLPDEVAYERLFVFSPQTMPSRGFDARMRSGSTIASVPTSFAPSAPGRPSTRLSPRMPTLSGSHAAASSPSLHNPMNALARAEMEAHAATRADASGETARLLREKRAELRAREKDLEFLRTLERAQVEFDTLDKRRKTLAPKASEAEKIRDEIGQLSKLLEEDALPSGLPPGFAEKLRQFEKLAERHQSEKSHLEAEIAALAREHEEFCVVPLVRDRHFLGGLSLAVASIVASVMLAIPTLALANILGASIAVAGAFRWVRDLERKARLEHRSEMARERLEKSARQYHLDTGVTKRLLEKFGVETPAAMLERLDAREALANQLRETTATLDLVVGDPDVQRAEQELRQIQGRLLELDEILMASAAPTDSIEAMRQETARLEREIRQLEARARAPIGAAPPSSSGGATDRVTIPEMRKALARSATPSDLRDREELSSVDGADDEVDGYGSGYGLGGTNDPDGGGSALSSRFPHEAGTSWLLGGFGDGPRGRAPSMMHAYGTEGSAVEPDRSRDLMQAAVDVLQLPTDDLARAIASRLGAYLSAFTDGAFVGAEFGPRGEVGAKPPGGGPVVAYRMFQGNELDAIDAALRFTLIEAMTRTLRVPVIFDDPFEHFPPRRRGLLVERIAELSKRTQIIVLTARDDIAGHAVPL